MNTLFKQFQESYFTDFIHFLVLLVCFIISVKLNNKHKVLNVFQIYFGCFVTLKIISYYCYATPSKEADWVISGSDYFFTILEYACFAVFFHKVITLPKQQNLVRTTNYLYFALALGILIKDILANKPFNEHSVYLLFTIQSVGLLVPSVLYLSNTLQNERHDVTNNPSFWVASGTTLFMLSTLPYSIFMNHLYDNYRPMFNTLFSIFFIFYIIMCLMMLRGYLCNPTMYSKDISSKKERPQKHTSMINEPQL